MSITTEHTFESALVQSFVDHGGYTEGNAANNSKLISTLSNVIG